VRHRLGLATRTQISVCKSPFPSAGTAVSLVRAKTVQQRPLLPREVETLTTDGSKRRSLLMAGDDDEMFMTIVQRYAKDNKTAFNCMQ